MNQDKKTNEPLDEDYYIFVQELLEKEKKFKKRIENGVESLKSSKYGKIKNFFFPQYNESVDSMILLLHSHIKESEVRGEKIEKWLKENREYFLKQK